MSDSTVGLPPDSTGKEVRTFRQTVGANQVEVQGIALCDPANATAVASVVTSAPATNAAGLVTRSIPFGTEATAAKQDTGNASLVSLLTTLTSVLTALQGTLTTSAAALPLPAGAATQATLASVLAALQSTLTVGLVGGTVEISNDIGNPLPVSGTVTASGPLTDTQLRATPVPVSMSGSSGGLTDTQLRAAAVSVAVSNLPGTQPVSGTVNVGNFPVTSGTVTANAGLNLNTSTLALEAGNLAALVGKDFATQTTLAAILTKIITAPATEATLAALLAEAQNDKALQETIWTDGTNFFIRRLVFDESAQSYTVSYTTPSGGATTLPGGAYPVATGADREIVSSIYAATAGGTGYTTGDTIGKREVWDVATATPAILATFWENLTTGATLSGTPANIAYSGATPGAATAANQATGNTTLASILAKLITAPATEATLASILAKLIAGPATETTLSVLSGKIPALGGAAAAASLPVVLSSDGPFVSATGAITETAPATDTASSGLNGRLQRIAQRISSLLALLPASLGIKTAANSLSIAPASDAIFTVSSVGVTYTDRSGTITAGGTAQQMAAANASRKGYFIQNNSTSDLWINSVTTAVLSQPSIKLPAGALYEAPANGVPVTAISIIGATTAQAFSAREY